MFSSKPTNIFMIAVLLLLLGYVIYQENALNARVSGLLTREAVEMVDAKTVRAIRKKQFEEMQLQHEAILRRLDELEEKKHEPQPNR